MTYFAVENFLSNFSFLVLFLSMILYWILIGFKWKIDIFLTLLTVLANVSLFLLLILRWKESGHFPLSNLYESLMFLSWSCTLIQLIIENWTTQKFFGCIISPTALLTNAFATFSLPLQMQKASSLVPALQSNWLMMHVTVMILSYAALICGSLLSMAFLIITRDVDDSVFFGPEVASYSKDDFKKPIVDEQYGFVLVSGSTNNNENVQSDASTPGRIADTLSVSGRSSDLLSTSGQSPFVVKQPMVFGKTKIEMAKIFDNLSYRILGIGFPLLTIGILSGAVWANEAWGSYWSWDPKETWALLTWFVFAIYLHMRLTKGWQGKKPALIASLGFVVVWMCFLGVNLIGEGLHSYGWIKG